MSNPQPGYNGYNPNGAQPYNPSSQPQNPYVNQDYSSPRNQNLVQNQNPYAGYNPQPQAYNPNQYVPQPTYATPTNFKPAKKKGNATLVIGVLLLVVLLAGVGTGGYLFWDYSNKSTLARSVSSAMDNNFKEYNDLSEKTVSSLKEMENVDHSLTSADVSALQNLDSALNDEIAQLQKITTEHENVSNKLTAGPNIDTDSFKVELRKKIDASKVRVRNIIKSYESLSCFNDKNMQFASLTEDILKISADLQSSVNSATATAAIKSVGDMVEALNLYLGVIDDTKPCFGDTGGVFDEDQALADIENASTIYTTLRDGYSELKVALEQRSTPKFNSAREKISSVQNAKIGFKENHYAIFDDNVAELFAEYYEASKNDKKNLQAKEDEVNTKYKVRDSFLGF